MTETSDFSLKRTSAAIRTAIFVAAGLAVIKIVTGFWTHSMAVMASALDSAMDVASSVVNFIALREASKPPDEDHAYGHGKIESLASLFQSTAIGVSGLYLVFESGKRLFTGSFVRAVPVGMTVMVLSMVVTGLLLWRLNWLSRRIPSLILSTERMHFSADTLSNAGILLALFLTGWTGYAVWDLAVCIIVAASIFRIAFGIWKKSVDELLDRSLPPAAVENIKRLIFHFNPSIVGIHNFRSHRVSGKIFLDFHIEIRGEEDFKRAHLMTESLISKIKEKYPDADVTVHFDPEGES